MVSINEEQETGKSLVSRIIFFLIGLVLVVVGLNQLQVERFYANTKPIQGSFEYMREVPLRHGAIDFKIKVAGYENEYTIPTIIRTSFNHVEFIKNVSPGDRIIIYLQAKDSETIAQVIGEDVKYIDTAKRDFRRRRNGVVACLAAGVFVLIGILKK